MEEVVEIISSSEKEVTIQVTIALSGSLLEMEGKIQSGVNKVGVLASEEALKQFDVDGSPLEIEGTKLTSKGKNNKGYQTPYGVANVERHVYQTREGGSVYCPLEERGRIIRGATPKFAQQLSHKYSTMHAPAVCRDLSENHGRKVAHSYVQAVSDWVGSIAQAQEEAWDYEIPKLEEAIKTVVLSLDGAYILMKGEAKGESGWREAMVGSLSLYDVTGTRQHTIYLGEAPEYGKQGFFERFEREIKRVKQHYPDALYLGIADGAKQNWTFLEQHTERQLLDFFHVTEYLAQVAYAAHPGKTDKPQRTVWLEQRCHQLKHESGTVDKLLEEMQRLSNKKSLSKKVKGELAAALTYFNNHQQMMDYASHQRHKLPIGSGVIEAACKTLVKQRLCGAGMRWKTAGAKVILSLRALLQSTGRWDQFWLKIDQQGAFISA